MNQNTQSTDLDQALSKTDFGQFVNNNKKSILILGALAFVIVSVITAYKLYSEEREAKLLEKVYSVSVSNFTPFMEDKLEVEAFNDAFIKMDDKVLSQATIVPLVMNSSSKLVDADRSDLAIAHLEKLYASLKSSSHLKYYVGLQLAPLYEDNERLKDALKIYEALAQGSRELIKHKIYLNLARVHLELGNKDDARKNFDYIINNYPDTEHAKLAKLYLNKL